MTSSTFSSSASQQFASFRSDIAARAKQLSFKDAATVAYNIAVAVGVVAYLVFLAARATINLGRTAKSLYIKYQISAKLQAAYVAAKAEVQALPGLSVRVAEVKDAYSRFAAQVLKVANATKADIKAIGQVSSK